MQLMVAVGALIWDNNKVLLGKHVPERKGFWQGKWICPGGRLEPGETLKAGAIREVKEETGLDVEIMGFLLSFDRIYTDNQGPHHVIYIDYLVKVVGGTMKAASDLGVAQWFSKSDLAQILGDIHEDTVVLLRRAGLVEEEK
jgi:8-oxo-dGTP diphosphatase